MASYVHTPNPQRLVDLVDDLLGSGEVAWVEFKHNNADPERIGVVMSAISNAARLAGQQTGYILWGIKDQDRAGAMARAAFVTLDRLSISYNTAPECTHSNAGNSSSHLCARCI